MLMRRWARGLAVGAGLAAAYPLSDERQRRRIVAAGEASWRAARLVGTVSAIVLDYKLTGWRAEAAKKGKFSGAQASVEQAEKELEIADAEAKRAEQYLSSVIHTASLEQREAAEAEARRTMDLAAEKVEALVQLRNSLDKKQEAENRLVHQRSAERLLHLARANRGVYIKVAQHLAQLDYLLPDEYTDTLIACFNDAPRSTFEEVNAVILEDLGAMPSELFVDFDPTPFASASLAQVHVAYLKDQEGQKGQKVAVKVQHRGLRETAVGDVDAVSAVTSVVSQVFPQMPLWWIADEIAPNIWVELDFHQEALNAQRCSKLYCFDDAVTVPQVFKEMSSERVLTMSFENGVIVTDLAAIDNMGISRQKLATLISRTFCRQVFEEGFVHCDPHPANLLVRPNPGGKHGDPQIVLLDHGLYRQLDDEFMWEYCLLWKSLVFGQVDLIREQCQNFGAGDMYPLLAAMLTARPWNNIVDPNLDSLKIPDTAEEKAKLKQYAAQYAVDIGQMLNRVPRQMLLLFKANDCLRHLDRRLGSPVNTFVITARMSAVALSRHKQRKSKGVLGFRALVYRVHQQGMVEMKLFGWWLSAVWATTLDHVFRWRGELATTSI